MAVARRFAAGGSSCVDPCGDAWSRSHGLERRFRKTKGANGRLDEARLFWERVAHDMLQRLWLGFSSEGKVPGTVRLNNGAKSHAKRKKYVNQ